MKKITKVMQTIILIVISCFLLADSGSVILAAENKQSTTQQPSRSFTVKAIIPDNQINKQLTYYDLQTKPNQKQTLKLLVTNLGTKKLKVTVRINNAYTSQNGVISYDKPYVKLYQAQQPALSDLVIGTRYKKLTLAPQHSQIVKFTYRAPKKQFKGIMLGGITASAGVGTSDNKNLTIQNRIRYVTGVVLHSDASPVKPHLTLGPRIGAQSRSMQPGLGFELQNAQPVNISQMQLHVRVTSNKHHVPVRKINNAQMAPNSTWDAFVPYKNLAAGSYVLHLQVKAKGGLEQEFTRKFTITKDQQNQLNKNQHLRNWPIVTWIVLIIVLGVILVIGYLLWVYMQGRKLH
ncbi:MAG: DUF916 and DUF3324 domain-containing protein [Lactobacillus sp.]|nr:DUF916 and DUF3324 domain-containing protein [Lactobacillus sp.]